MRILHYVRQFHPSVGGIQDVVLQIARRQAAAGHHVEVMTLDRIFATDESLPARGEVDGIPVTRVPFRGIRQYPWLRLDLDKINEFDVFHIHCVDSMLDKMIFLRRRIRGAVFLTTHGLYFHTEKFARIKQFFYHHVTPRALRRIDKVFACSRNDYELIGRIIPDADRLMLLENGVALDKFLPAEEGDERSEDMIYIGRIASHKNVTALIDRFLEAKPKGRLHLVGQDFDGTMDRLQARRLPDSVVFHGGISTSAIADLSARCRYFVSASSFEGFGLSAVEAMGAGLIPILNDIPPFRDLVEEHGGYVIDFNKPGSMQDLLEKARLASTAELETQGEKLQKSVQRYSWEEKVSAMLNQYQQALDRRPLDRQMIKNQTTGKPQHLMLAASFGGHWKQLMVIQSLLTSHDERRLSFVSTSPETPREVTGAGYYQIPDCNAGERFKALRCLGSSLRLMHRLRPDLLITTGALPGLLLAAAAKLTGTRVIWVDSVANAECLSTSGRMASRFVDLCCTQWEHLANADAPKGPVYFGSVL